MGVNSKSITKLDFKSIIIMLKTYKFNIAMLCCLAVSFLANAQDSTAVASKMGKRAEKKAKVEEPKDTAFPEKKRDNIGITLHLGDTWVTGDENARHIGPAIGLGVRKSLGHVMSVRLFGNYGVAKGWNLGTAGAQPLIVTRNDAYNGVNDARANYGSSPVLMTYKNTHFQGKMHFMFNLNNINFYHRQNKANFYLFGGPGFNTYRVMTNALDASGNKYDFTGFDFFQSEKSMKKAANAKFDKTYETGGEMFGTGFKKYRTTWMWNGGAGVQYRLNKRFAIGYEYNVGRVCDDLLDNRQLTINQNDNLTNSTDFDWHNLQTAYIEFRPGKGEESFWWVNPLAPTYDKLAELDKKVKDATTDTDGDGVADVFDLEPDTPADCMVDTHGRTLDLDRDGVADCKDKEPFSPPGATVDKDGVSLDADGDGVPDFRDREPNSPAGALVDRNGSALDAKIAAGGTNMADWWLPMMFFDLDKSYIRSDMMDKLKHVCTVMRRYPNMKVEIVGYTDVRAGDSFNEKLSERRAKNVFECLVKDCGIDPNRLVMRYEGEQKNLVKRPKNERGHSMNRRVEFHVLPQ